MTIYKKKLIEVALPLDAINAASAREKSIRHGHPSTLHLWWARRPLAAARAVIFSQMVDDPSEYVDVLRGDKDLMRKAKAQLKKRKKVWDDATQLAKDAERAGISAPAPGPEPTLDEILAELERERLFTIIEDLVKWENTTNEKVLQSARDEIWQSWRRACAENAGHPRAKELFDRQKLPGFHDPFAGGGALPLEAQRLGLEAYASDLNPVAVLINKAMIEIPPKFAGMPPVNPESRKQWLGDSHALPGADAVAEGDGGRKRGLPAGPPAAARGDLRDAVTTDAGRGIGSSQHCGGMEPGIAEGESAVSGDCAGIAGGKRNVSDPVRGNRLVSEEPHREAEGPVKRGGQDADNDAAQVPEQPLASNSYELFSRTWQGAQGLAEDVRYYGKWMRDEAEKRIGHLYPKIEVTAEMAKERKDLKPYVGKKLTVIAWLWARTVKSPNPAFAHVDVPLASTFMLSTKKGKEAYVEPVIGTTDGKEYRFKVCSHPVREPGDSDDGWKKRVESFAKRMATAAPKNGTKLARGANFQCLMSGSPMAGDHIKAEGRAGRMGARLMAIVAEGDRGRVYLAPTPEMEAVALTAKPPWKPELKLSEDKRAFWTPPYGLKTYADLFTPRQLVALTTFSDLVQEARERVLEDAQAAWGVCNAANPASSGTDETSSALDHASSGSNQASSATDKTSPASKHASSGTDEASSASYHASFATDKAPKTANKAQNAAPNAPHTSLTPHSSSLTPLPLSQGGTGPTAYADAVAVYLALVVSKQTVFLVTQARWRAGEGKSAPAFGRQALPMVWDFADLNPFAGAGGDFLGIVDGARKTLDRKSVV